MHKLCNKALISSLKKIPHKDFVMHGSERTRKILAPKKPLGNVQNNGRSQRAVYGTSVITIAILYACIGNAIFKRTSTGICILTAKENVEIFNGYICICKRKTFSKGVFVSLSKKAVKVLFSIKINSSVLDLLEDRKEIYFFKE